MIFWQIWLMQPMQQPSWCGLGRSAGTPSACCVWRARLSSAGWGDIATKLPDEVIKATGAPDNSSAVTAVSAMVHVICAVSLRGA